MNARRVRDYENGFRDGRIAAFSQCGFSCREIADEVGITYSAVAKILRKRRRNALRLRIPLGRTRKTTARADRLLLRLARNNRLSSATQLLRMWRERVSKWTVYRRLRLKGLRKYRLLRVPFLSRNNIADRLRWAQRRVLYREVQWDRIVWSDESPFCLNFNDGRARVWRERGRNRLHPDFVAPEVQGNGGSVHVWGAIWTTGRSELQILRRTVTGATYIETLERFLQNPNLPPDWRLQDDNARPHRARIVTEFKQAAGIRSIDWPSRSPDLNPIEHIWDVMGRAIHEQDPPPNLHQLGLRLIEVWNNIPQNTIRDLIRSMNRRIAAVIAARGGNTRY